MRRKLAREHAAIPEHAERPPWWKPYCRPGRDFIEVFEEERPGGETSRRERGNSRWRPMSE